MDLDLSYRDSFAGGVQAVVINCGKPIKLSGGRVLGSFQSGLFTEKLKGERLIVLEVGNSTEVKDSDADTFRKDWKDAFEALGIHELKGLEIHISPRKELDDLAFTFFYFGKNVPGSIHRKHDFFELHTQILGRGEMQKFHECNEKTLYETEAMSPGQTHNPFFDERGNYPWHRYRSVTRSLFLAIESQKPIP